MKESIKELLYEHDCVIIPDLGGFVGNYKPAKLDENKHMFYPPSKQISFNKNLTHDDGLLTHHFAKRKEIDFKEARAIITQKTKEIQHELHEHKRFDIPELGLLFLNKEAGVGFIPDEKHNYLKASFGLKPFYVKPLEQKETVKATPGKKGPQVPESIMHIRRMRLSQQQERIQKKRRSHAWKYALSAVITLLITVGTLLITNSIDIRNSQLSGLFFSESHASLYEPRDKAFELEFESAALPEFTPGTAVQLTDELTLTIIEKSAPPVSTDVATGYTPAASSGFFVIGGCFEYEVNAHKFVRQLQAEGHQAFILDQNKGLYRVAYGSYNRRNEALQALSSIRNQNSGAWLLKK